MTERAQGLRRATERMLRRRAATGAVEGAAPLWDADQFGLERLASFARASEASRTAVLDDCAAQLLAESWFIEVCGITFCARMALRAESLEERRLYAVIGADEATHSAWLEPWVARDTDAQGAFEHFIVRLIEGGAPQPLAYLLQIVLEGFGIVHYAGLGATCRDGALAATLTRISQDEALHHAGGLASFVPERMGERDLAFLTDAAASFLDMMRSGPQGVVGAVDRGLTRGLGLDGATAVAEVFADLDAEAMTRAKLARLRKLMDQPGMSWLIEALEHRGAFTPCTPAECAAIYLATR